MCFIVNLVKFKNIFYWTEIFFIKICKMFYFKNIQLNILQITVTPPPPSLPFLLCSLSKTPTPPFFPSPTSIVLGKSTKPLIVLWIRWWLAFHNGWQSKWWRGLIAAERPQQWLGGISFGLIWWLENFRSY